MLRDSAEVTCDRFGNCQADLDGLVSWLSTELGQSRPIPTPGTSFDDQFARWFDRRSALRTWVRLSSVVVVQRAMGSVPTGEILAFFRRIAVA